MTIDEIKRISIVGYLSTNGYKIAKQNGKRFWYLSPLHTENTASFKVDDDINLWYDFGLAQGGNIINLAQLLHPSMSMHEVLLHLKKTTTGSCSMSIHTPKQYIDSKKTVKVERKENETEILKLTALKHPYLLEYITSRNIHIDVAKEYCKEVHYRVNGGKTYYAIAFMNIDGGMEVRNKYSKRCIGSKSPSVIIHHQNKPSKQCCVFEGFFDFLSYKTSEILLDERIALSFNCDCIILNSVTNLDKAVTYLQQYEQIYCYLDNDAAGETATLELMNRFVSQAVDQSTLYQGFNDINDFLTNTQCK
ncbi:MAG: toprim domain-containing protein [Phocaeicola sp.]